MKDILSAIIKINEELEEIEESTASFPSEDLPLDIWDKTEDGNYKLKPELKEMILDALAQYPEEKLLDLAESIKIVGSIGTNLYDEDADIDVHIEPKADFFEGKSEEEIAEFQREVMNWFKNEREEKNWFVNKHPMEVYIQINPIQDYFSDTVYDLMSDEWIKVPKKYSMEYNPYIEYGDIFEEIDEVAAPADALLGKIRRALKDIARLKKANQEETLLTRKEEIEKSILALKECKESWRAIRRRNSAELPDEVPEDPETLQHSDEWKRDNTIFKLLDIDGYFKVVNALADLLDEESKLPNDFEESVHSALNEFCSF